MTRMTLALPLIFAVSFTAFASEPPKRSIERLSPKLDELLAPDAKVEELAEGFKWSEGPVWDAKNQRLLFSDIPNNTVMEWTDAGKVKPFLHHAGYTGTRDFGGKEPGSNGLALDKDGHLILCQHGDRCIARLTKDKKFEKLAEKYQGKRFNSPNDLVVLENGDIVFTDPPYGLPGGEKDPERELDFQGVFRLKPSGEVILLTKSMTRPNGLAFSPDRKTLYVANSDPAIANWMSFPVKDDGSLGEGKVFFDVTDLAKKKLPGLPDGMKIDVHGNIWATGPGGLFIFDKEGTHLGTISTNTPTANCAWGDDGSTLYITANDRLIRIKTKTKGW